MFTASVSFPLCFSRKHWIWVRIESHPLWLPGSSGFSVLILLPTSPLGGTPRRSVGVVDCKGGFRWQSPGLAHIPSVIYEKYSCGIYKYTRVRIRGILFQVADQCSACVSQILEVASF